jgi:ABC-type dipeptide/oligopeptide/nickel transport system permease component
MKLVLARAVHFVSLWLGVVAATFALFHLVPTDPARTALGPNATEEQVFALRRTLGLDQPVPQQLTRYFRRASRLDFGTSYVDQRQVGPEVRRKLVVTVALAAMSIGIIIAYLVTLSALTYSGAFCLTAIRVCNFIFVASPVLFSAVLIGLLAVWIYPFTRFSGSLSTASDWLFLLPPAFVLALYPMGVLGRIASKEISAVEASEFVLAARARGLGRQTVLFSYVLRNCLVPLLAALGNQLPLLLTSTFIVEIVFSVPGLGSLLLKSVLQRDLPMLEGIVVITSLLTIMTGLILELTYPRIDPRIGLSRVV